MIMENYQPPSTEEVRSALMRKAGQHLSGYVLEQVHGQRKLFDPVLKNSFSPMEGSEVFVGRLPRDLYEDELAPVFLKIGKIYEMRVMMNFSRTNRGFAFVTFLDPDTAQLAVTQLNNYAIRPGQRIGVMISFNNRRLEIKNLSRNDWILNPASQLHQLVCHLTEGVESVNILNILPRKRNYFWGACPAPSLSAIVTYETHHDAAMARRKLIPLQHEIFNPQVEIDWDIPHLDGKRRRYLP